MNELRLEKLFKYLELLSGVYFTDDPLNIKPSIERVTFLIEMEINKSFEEDDDE